MSHVIHIEYVQINHLILFKYCCEKICKPRLRYIQQRSEDKWSPKWSSWACFKKKNQHICFLVHGHSFFLVHIRFTPSERPKAFKTEIFFPEVGPWTRTIEKGHLPWSDFMVRGGNRPYDRWSLALLKSKTCKLLGVLCRMYVNLSQSHHNPQPSKAQHVWWHAAQQMGAVIEAAALSSLYQLAAPSQFQPVIGEIFGHNHRLRS